MVGFIKYIIVDRSVGARGVLLIMEIDGRGGAGCFRLIFLYQSLRFLSARAALPFRVFFLFILIIVFWK